ELQKEKISIKSNFFEIGGHSLKATTLMAAVHKQLEVKISLAEIFEAVTVEQLAKAIAKKKKETYTTIEPAEQREYYELSSAQKRLYILQQMEESATGYNMCEAILLEGTLHPEKLEKTFRQLIARHESLRTSFEIIGGEPVQRIHHQKEIDFSIENYEMGEEGERAEAPAGIIEGFLRPFDLTRAPLLRVGLIKPPEPDAPAHRAISRTPPRQIIIIDMHHIISDGTSVRQFEKEFMALYDGEEMGPQRIQYKDYSQWRKSKDVRETLKQQENYWLEQMDGELPVLELPLDYIRPTHQGYEGDRQEFQLDVEETAAMNKIARETGATLYMTLLALLNIFLSKMSGMEDIIVGTPIAGRGHADLETVIGMFISTLCMRNKPAGKKRFTDLLREVKNGALAAFENQEYPYEELVEKVDVKRDTSRNPLFDVMFVLQNLEENEVSIPGLKLSPYPFENPTSKFDMTLQAIEIEGRLEFSLEYSTKLFKKETINRFIGYFRQIATTAIKNPTREIYKIEVLPAAEKQRLLIEFNKTAKEYPKDKTIYELFQEQVEKTPEKEAVRVCGQEGEEQTLTYRELNENTNRLARILRRRGVKANTVVGIMLERTLELIEAIYAVLKSGAAYLPIDPGYPPGRIKTMLKQGKATLLLTGKENRKKLEENEKNSPEIVIPAELGEEAGAEPGDNLQPLSGPGDLIYIIFTSGSTGIPKGAGVYHRSFVNLVNWFVKEYRHTERDRNMVVTSFSFDLTQKNYYAPLVTGGTVCLPSVKRFDPSVINREIARNKITWINSTPSMFFQMIDNSEGDEYRELASIRKVYLGGEPLVINMFMKWQESENSHGKIVNTYGPTECTDISNAFLIAEP
ncbi:MAG: AMP-binding protein, partial [bacterium]|nr:AMP-binding protein [bacterium]